MVVSVSTATTGAVRSTVTARGTEAALTFPAASLVVAVTVCSPSDNAAAVVSQIPLASDVVVAMIPSILDVSVISTLASAKPKTVGVVFVVMLSVLEMPVSLVAIKSRETGMAGAVASIMSARAAESGPGPFPNVSVWRAVSECEPSLRTLVVMDQSPAPSTVVVPTPPLRSEVSVRTAPGSPVPESVGVVTLVRSSSSAVPRSLAASRSGVPGATGVVVSMVNSSTVESDDEFPAASVAVTEMS